MVKVFKKNNYIVVEEDGGRKFKGLAKEVEVYANDLNNEFKITNLKEVLPFENDYSTDNTVYQVLLSDLKDESNVAYNITTWEDFYTAETGKSSASGSGSTAWGDITGKPSTFTPSAHTHPISEVTDLQTSLDAKADLIAGKVPASQLPAYVDDVLEFANLASFPVTGENDKIYIAIDTNLTYRWAGSVYVLISDTIALGETSSTAYRGDRGKTAYDHSQATGNPHGTTIGQIPGLQTELDGKVDALFFDKSWLYTDFYSGNQNQNAPVSGAAINGGTSAISSGNYLSNAAGVVQVTSGTAANSGYSWASGNSVLLLKGREQTKGRVMFDSFVDLKVFVCFVDQNTAAAPVDGVFFEVSPGGVLEFKTHNNSTPSIAAFTTVLTTSVWYTFHAVLNDTATSVTGYLYNENGNTVESKTIATNIPTGSGRFTGFGIYGYKTTSGVATDLFKVDAIGIYNDFSR